MVYHHQLNVFECMSASVCILWMAFSCCCWEGWPEPSAEDLLMPEMLCEMLYLTQNCQTSDTLFVRSYAWTQKRETCKNSQIAKDAWRKHTHSLCVCMLFAFDILPGISFHCWCCKCAINGRTVILAMVMVVVWWFDLTGSWACFISRYKHILAHSHFIIKLCIRDTHILKRMYYLHAEGEKCQW